ncbi:MAG TPA: 3D domain-containing protein [Kofleriaceae bacterium]|nr:3D domain-containing protein [Kofleriaceae bacterium]
MVAISQTAPAPDRDTTPDAGVPQPKAMGDFEMTFYYLIVEGETGPGTRVGGWKPQVDAGVPETDQVAAGSEGSDETLAAAAPEPPVDPDLEMVPIYEGGTCNVIAEVTHRFFAELALQGSGQLKDGRVLNVFGHCDCPTSSCFQVAKTSKWGLAGTGRALSPYRTVAVDPKVVPLGSLLYIPVLDGLRMPGPPPTGGFIHDGCVVADDTGGNVQGKQVDLFVGRRAYWLALGRHGGSHTWARHVQVFDGTGRCTRRGGQVSRSAAGSI